MTLENLPDRQKTTWRPFDNIHTDMKNLHSLLKSRDIILQTKVHIVKSMVFPVVMYGLLRVGPKGMLSTKELMLLNCLLEKTLESLLDCKEIKLVNPKENQP